MLDSPMLVDQNDIIVCGSNKDQRDHLPRIHLDVSLFSGIHQICIPTFPFDPPTQSDTYTSYTILILGYNNYMLNKNTWGVKKYEAKKNQLLKSLISRKFS